MPKGLGNSVSRNTIEMVKAGLIVSIFIGFIINLINDVNTSTWSTTAATIWGYLEYIVIAVVILGFIKWMES